MKLKPKNIRLLAPAEGEEIRWLQRLSRRLSKKSNLEISLHPGWEDILLERYGMDTEKLLTGLELMMITGELPSDPVGDTEERAWNWVLAWQARDIERAFATCPRSHEYDRFWYTVEQHLEHLYQLLSSSNPGDRFWWETKRYRDHLALFHQKEIESFLIWWTENKLFYQMEDLPTYLKHTTATQIAWKPF